MPLIEDLEQIFMRSWRESHLSEIRQYQQPQTPATQGRLYGIEVKQCVGPIAKKRKDLEPFAIPEPAFLSSFIRCLPPAAEKKSS